MLSGNSAAPPRFRLQAPLLFENLFSEAGLNAHWDALAFTPIGIAGGKPAREAAERQSI